MNNWDKKVSFSIADFSLNKQQLAGFFAKSGDNLPWFIFTTACFVFNIFMSREIILIQHLAIAVTAFFVFSLKFTIRRKRPKGTSDNYKKKYVTKRDPFSFPSGHAGRMATLAAIMTVFYPKFGWIFILWALLVNYGRIAIKVHYFLDILGGTLVGTLVGLLFYFLQAKICSIITPFVEWIGNYLF